jgi:hypothetical protein
MNLSSIRWWHILWTLIVGLIALPFVYFGVIRPLLYDRMLRYRMTVEIEADGKVHLASSVAEITYTSGSTAPMAPSWYAKIKGTAPIIDLGRHGSVIAAFTKGSADKSLWQRAREIDRVRGETGWGGSDGVYNMDQVLLGAYNLGPRTITQARGKVFVTKYYPNFVWIPANSSWRAAQQLFPEDFEAKIGAGVRLKQITIEPASGKPVPIKVEHPPMWLLELRRDQPPGSLLGSRDHWTFDHSFFEREH